MLVHQGLPGNLGNSLLTRNPVPPLSMCPLLAWEDPFFNCCTHHVDGDQGITRGQIPARKEKHIKECSKNRISYIYLVKTNNNVII